jgi:dihydrofolate synthase/folylpolyglutamate synthase
MAYRDSLEYLSQLKSKGINLDLGPVSRLLSRLGNPHMQYKSILVGGSNGKGSVAAALSSILVKGGFEVGLYTSPHLIDFRERIRVDGNMISRDDLSDIIELVRSEVHENVTYFEFATALAFLYFYVRKVDIVLLEVGMGGRLDATNVVVPELSIITNICLEHQAYLGRNIADIAREKGGIIKEGGICVTAARQPAVLSVLEDICTGRNARLLRIGRDFRSRKARDGTFFYYGIDRQLKNLFTPLTGDHQIDNMTLALAGAEILNARGVDINDNAVVEGIKDVRWAGRLETVSTQPPIVVDGAHNPAAVTALCRSLSNDFVYNRLILLFGVLKDKDSKGMLRRLVPYADTIIFTQPGEQRAVEAGELAAMAAGAVNKKIYTVADPRSALKKAISLAREKDLICATGSLYLVGEIKKALSDISP